MHLNLFIFSIACCRTITENLRGKMDWKGNQSGVLKGKARKYLRWNYVFSHAFMPATEAHHRQPPENYHTKNSIFEKRLRISGTASIFLQTHMQHHEENLVCLIWGCGHVAGSKAGSKSSCEGSQSDWSAISLSFLPDALLNRQSDFKPSSPPYKRQADQVPFLQFWNKPQSVITDHVCRIHPSVVSGFVYGRRSICDHCNVIFTCVLGLAIHRMTLSQLHQKFHFSSNK